MSDLSAIIVNYNAGRLLKDAVNSLLSSDAVTRIIVVDNDSEDNSMKEIEDLAYSESRLMCIRNSINSGFAKACNMGIAAYAESDYFLFLNPDCIMEKDALEKLLSCMKSFPQAGIAGPLLLNPNGTEQAGGRRSIPTPWRSFIHTFGLSKLNKHYAGIFPDFVLHEQPLPEGPVEIEAISGACMLVRRDAFLDIGFMDTGYFLHCEDLDWFMRCRQMGWKIMFVPDARVIHYKGICSKTRPIFVEWNKHKGMILFYNKFFRHQYPGALLWIIETGVWLRFAAISFYYGLMHLKNLIKHDVS